MRRAVSGLAVAIGLATVAAPIPLRGQEGATVPFDSVFELHDLAPGVWAAEVLSRPAAYAFANSLIVILGDGVLVVDTQQSPTAARALLAKLRELTDLPVRWVVNTHWHPDHVYGNQVYADAFPGVTFIAHAATREEVRAKADSALRHDLADIPETIRQREEWLETGEGPGGEPLTEEDRESLRYSIRMRTGYLEDLRALRLTPPTVVFERRLVLAAGTADRTGSGVGAGDGSGRDGGAAGSSGNGRTVELLHFGPAHTRGDVVVWLPGEGILAAGDLLEAGLPWVDGGSDPVGWAAVLDSVAALEPRILLPAHGGVSRDGELLARQRDLFRWVAGRASDTAPLTDREIGQAMPWLQVTDGEELERARAWLEVALQHARAATAQGSRDS